MNPVTITMINLLKKVLAKLLDRTNNLLFPIPSHYQLSCKARPVAKCKSAVVQSTGTVFNPLTLTQTTNFKLFQTKSLQPTTIHLMKMTKFSKQPKTTVGKEEIVHYEQFLPFPQCFQKTCTAVT